MADHRVGQRLTAIGAERLESEPALMGGAIPLLEWGFGEFDALALDDRHLSPHAVEPDVLGNEPGGAPATSGDDPSGKTARLFCRIGKPLAGKGPGTD